jgi:predicted transcriptional regulator
MPTTATSVSDQLREAILNADISRYRLAKDVGVTEAALSRFIHKRSGLSRESIDVIGERLGIMILTTSTRGVSKMAKKKTAGQKAAETKARKPATLWDIDWAYPNLCTSMSERIWCGAAGLLE